MSHYLILWRLIPYFITTTLFSVAHVSVDQNGFDITASAARIFSALTLGIVFAIIRFRTKSLLGGIVAHNAANLTITFVNWNLR
jgi:membrane protease YdiL (CAAX protease family)